MNFLSARWEHLLLANYSVDADVLQPFVPARTSIDRFEGHAFVSLVAFMFKRTRVLGLPIPFHVNFEEVNLRFYVTPDHDPSKRAVTFIKEIVPRTAIPLIANSLFHENYVALPMQHSNEPNQHRYSWNTGTENWISANVSSNAILPVAGSVGEFITEHYWGYAKAPRYTLEYQVTHPQWKCCDVTNFDIQVDFASTYGKAFSFLQDQSPHSVQYAVGSSVGVSFPKRI